MSSARPWRALLEVVNVVFGHGRASPGRTASSSPRWAPPVYSRATPVNTKTQDGRSSSTAVPPETAVEPTPERGSDEKALAE